MKISAILIAAALLSVAGCAATSKHESTGEYIDDSAITTKVKSAIFNEPSLKVADISVETRKQVVQLSGFVSSADEIKKASSLARAVPGVVSVRNDIQLKKREHQRRQR